MSLVSLSRRGRSTAHVVEVSLEGVEARGPHGPVGGEPLVDLLQGLAADAVEAALGVDPGFDRPASRRTRRCLETAGWLMERARTRSPTGALAVAEEIEDAPAVALGQYLERRQHAPQYSHIAI